MTRPVAPRAERSGARAIRGYATVVAVSLWTVAAWSLATPSRIDRFGTLKGVDFGSSWFSGRLVSLRRADLLYDADTWRSAFAGLFPDIPGLLFLPNYPPQAALFFSPFGRLPFEWAVVAWTIVSVVLYAGSVWAVFRLCPGLDGHGATLAIVAMGWPAFFLLVLNGQNTTIVLACYAAAAVAHAAGREFWMGVALGGCAIKPHFAIVPAVVMLLAGRWRALAGIAVMGAAQVWLAAAVLGAGVFVEWARAALAVAREPELFEPKLWQAHGLKNALDLVLGRGALSTALYVAAFVAAAWLVARVWRRPEAGRNGARFALLVAVSALLNPHLYGYDLVVLAPALVFAAEWSVVHADWPEARRMAGLVTALLLVPLAAPLAAFTHMQVSVPLLAWFGWDLLSLAAGPERPTVRP